MEQAFYAKVVASMEAFNEKKNKRNILMKSETYNQVVKILKGTESKNQAQFKFWAKNRFHLVKIGD